jgi:hypothetical protein
MLRHARRSKLTDVSEEHVFSVEPLLACCMLVSYLAYFSAVKMEETSSSEASVDIQRTTWCYIAEERNRQNIIINLSFVGKGLKPFEAMERMVMKRNKRTN